MAYRYQITCSAQLESLTLFRKLIDRACDENGITDGETRYDMKLAVDEACTNIIQHGYAGIAPGSIILTVELEADYAQLTITDFGHPFEPVDLPPPEVDSALEDLSVANMGVFFIHQSVDKIEYESSLAGNNLTLIKRFEKPAAIDKTQMLIANIPIFRSLSPVDHQYLAQQVETMEAQSGEVIAQEGESGDSFFIIAEGKIDVIKAMDTPEQTLLGVRQRGEFVGEMSLLNLDGRRTASLRASTTARLIVVKRSVFYELIRRQPILAYDMMQVLSNRLRDAHDEEIQVLQLKNQELQQAYDALKAAQAQLIEKEKLEHELQVARDIQLSMLPTQLPQPSGYELGALMAPARAVGGDFYDAFLLDSERLAVIIGDVSDKGVPAALFMAQTVALLRAISELSNAPGETLRRVNQLLLKGNISGQFVTVLYGVLHLPSGEFVYTRAGHETPLIVASDGNSYSAPMKIGTPLAVMEELLLDEQRLRLSPGETLLLYTDGVTDGLSIDVGAQVDGLEALQTLVKNAPSRKAQALCKHIFEEVCEKQYGRPQFDDVTLLAMCILEKGGK